MKRILSNPIYIFLIVGITFLLFDISFYILANYPGERNFACVPGAYLIPFNIAYAAIFSFMVASFIVGFIELLKLKAGRSGRLLSLSGLGFLFAGLTTFCTACTIPVISLFGISIGLSMFTEFNELFKVIAFLLMLLSLYLLDRQIRNKCKC